MYLQDIKGADGRVFTARDNKGNSMDGAKIIENPKLAGTFIAVYHSYDTSGLAKVNLAYSTDLLNWQFLTSLAGDAGKNATQATIAAVGDGFMLAHEQEPKNHVRLAYYENWEKLIKNEPANTFDTPMTLSAYAEGTPCIYSATPDSADIGFHYFREGKVDRQCRGKMTGWTEWTTSEQPQIDEALLSFGISGNVGDRDPVTYKGKDFLYIEGGGDNAHFGNWRCFLYDPETETADKLEIKTPGGSLAFANPTETQVTFKGRPTLVCSVFIPTENSAPGEVGCCIYYHYLDS